MLRANRNASSPASGDVRQRPTRRPLSHGGRSSSAGRSRAHYRLGRIGAVGLTPSTRDPWLPPSTTAARAGWRLTQSSFAGAGGLAASHSALPAIRATTHVDGKAIGSSRRARRGAGCWLRTTIGASGRTPISSSPVAWRRASPARRPLTGRACRDGRPGGGGSAGPRSGRSSDVRARAPVCARFRPRWRSSVRARTAHSRVVRGRRLAVAERDARILAIASAGGRGEP